MVRPIQAIQFGRTHHACYFPSSQALSAVLQQDGPGHAKEILRGSLASQDRLDLRGAAHRSSRT